MTIGILALAISIQCQPALPRHRDRPVDPELLEQTIRTARSAPPEVAADILLKIVESRLETRPKQMRSLVDEALAYIGQAQEPARLRQFRGGTESIGGTLRAGFTFGLDRISLNGRAIRVLLGSLNDRGAAVRAWEAMTNSLVLPRVDTCRTDLVPDFREYFRVLEEPPRGSTAAIRSLQLMASS